MTRRLVLGSILATLAIASVPAVSSATSIAGPNGKIVFTSGRPSTGVPAPNAGDAGARIFVADWPFGTPVQVTTLPAGAAVRHRQPNWSPDHTRIAYAAGSGASYAIWIVDLRTGSQTEFVAAAEGLDRPSWSPGGSRIAYNSGGDIYVKDVSDGNVNSKGTQLTKTADIDERPVWSPDGNTLYFNRGPEADRDIYKLTPVASTNTATGVLTGAASDWQPALSPDGNRLCYLEGPKASAAKLRTVGVDGTGDTPFTGDGLTGALNCVWSPDGTTILYTRGAFEAGELATRDINGASFASLTSMNVAEHFDGNSDWATNFSPKCDPKSANVGVNQFTTVTLSCTDPDSGFGAAPPTPDPLGDSSIEIVAGPKNGTIGGISDDEKVIYTPNKDFKGTDTFTYIGNDGTSDSSPATVTVRIGLAASGGGDTTAPAISGVKVSVKRWRLGKGLASISKAPVGTKISFNLSEAARATLTFQRAKPGRRVGRSCVKQTSANSSKRSCTRYVGAGSLGALSAKAGQNRVRFQGRLTASHSLTAGAYRVLVAAQDAAGNHSQQSNGPTFTIVPE